jgi:hypothetical protein
MPARLPHSSNHLYCQRVSHLKEQSWTT